jgi:hypothetical protein
MGRLQNWQVQERRKPLQAPLRAGGSGKMLDIVNFVNFAGGCRRSGRLEFIARHATSDAK